MTYVLNDIDLSVHPFEIAKNIWWVGHIQENDPFQCHVYLIEQDDQSVLIDPGSKLTFRYTLGKIEKIIPFSHIRYFICHHQDPDITGALPLIDELINRNDALLVTHWRAQALIKHYDLKLPFWLVDQNDWQLPLVDRLLKFIFTPYAHFPGAFCTFDSKTQLLFSSDLFGGFTEEFNLFAQDEGYFEALRPFHEHYIPSRDILNYALSQIEAYPVRLIAPQHGSIIPKPLVKPIIDELKKLDCGLFLYAKDSVQIQRLSQLNQILRELVEIIAVARDFNIIAFGLLQIAQRHLPIKFIDFYARMEDGKVLHLAPNSHYQASIIESSAFVDALFASNPLCSQHANWQQDQSDLVLVIPLHAPQHMKTDALALLHLSQWVKLWPETISVIQQIALPLQVAVEREVIHHMLNRERQHFYECSVRDPLTNLFTRRYMHDMVQHLFKLHDRDPAARVGLAMIDIDHFKRVNDTLGHEQGDLVLRQVATVLTSILRGSDFCVRLGGEEFAVFALGLHIDELNGLAERCRYQVERMTLPGLLAKWPITVSIGTAMRQPQENLAELIRRADQALYAAKQAGRNRVYTAEV